MVQARQPGTFVGDSPARRLFGRDGELAVVDGLIGELTDGVGGALLVRGDSGIGKSALLAVARAKATDKRFRVLSVTGIQSEARLPFAGLHQLLRPLLPGADRLAAPLRAALLAAFGMSDEAVAELFLIGLAALELISDAAEGSSVLIIADDAHWLDEPTCAVLAFVARRLAAERAFMLIAVRDALPSRFDEAELSELHMTGLDDNAAAALMDFRAPGLEAMLRARLLAEAAGNPLALVELPRALRPRALVERELVPSRLQLTARLERAFAVQGSGLPSATRSLLLVAAADDDGVLREVLDAASVLEGATVTADALVPVIGARLVETEGTNLRFRHPLVRSALYQAATVSERQAAHKALAESLANQPERRVWHRAGDPTNRWRPSWTLPPCACNGEVLPRKACPRTRRDRASGSTRRLKRRGALRGWPVGRPGMTWSAASVSIPFHRADVISAPSLRTFTHRLVRAGR